ncbi:MAG: transcription antitermination protein NusB, partial [Paraburkholderia sp.]|nr:transcription antitermination protein NusB [Paraburkholderia sp.]
MKSARRRSRELATQGLYQWLLSGAPVGEIDAQLRDAQGFDKADKEHLDAILRGVIRDAQALSADLTPCLDRPIEQLSPVERAVLLVAAYEFKGHPDV